MKLDQRATPAYVQAMASMTSDYDRAEVLLAFLNGLDLTAANRQTFVVAADRIGSSYDQNRVLAALVRSEKH